MIRYYKVPDVEVFKEYFCNGDLLKIDRYREGYDARQYCIYTYLLNKGRWCCMYTSSMHREYWYLKSMLKRYEISEKEFEGFKLLHELEK